MNTLLLCPGQSSARRKDNTKATPVVCNTNAKVQYQSITGAQFFCTKIQKCKTSATPQYSEYQSVQCSAVQMYLFCSYLWPAFLCKAIQYEWEHNIAFQFVCCNCTVLKCILVHCNVHCTPYTAVYSAPAILSASQQAHYCIQTWDWEGSLHAPSSADFIIITMNNRDNGMV